MAHSALGGTGVALAVGARVNVGWGKVGLGVGAWQPESSREVMNINDSSLRKIFVI